MTRAMDAVIRDCERLADHERRRAAELRAEGDERMAALWEARAEEHEARALARRALLEAKWR